jgi:hypothetical protein
MFSFFSGDWRLAWFVVCYLLFLSAGFASSAVSELKIVFHKFIGHQGHPSQPREGSYMNLK